MTVETYFKNYDKSPALQEEALKTFDPLIDKFNFIDHVKVTFVSEKNNFITIVYGRLEHLSDVHIETTDKDAYTSLRKAKTIFYKKLNQIKSVANDPDHSHVIVDHLVHDDDQSKVDDFNHDELKMKEVH